jgi:hypothetical protein
LARLGWRVAVLELHPGLPNVGFRLGLEPRAYLSHLVPEVVPWLEPGLLGVRVLCGLAGRASLDTLTEPVRKALGDIECVLATLPEDGTARALEDLGACIPAVTADTTLERAAARSPMIGAWLATAQRPAAGPRRAPETRPADAVLWLSDARRPAPPAAADLFRNVPLREVVWAASPDASGQATPWARVPPHSASRWPITAFDPVHSVARLFEGLAQSLLSGLGRSGGAHA